MKKLIWGTLTLLTTISLLATVTPAMGQEVTAGIVGTVTDPSNAPVQGATVTAADTDRGTSWSAQTNETGGYNLLRLPVGNYKVKVTKEGFQTATQPAFTLVLNQTARIDVQLKVGQASETVEVTSAAPVLQTESTEVSTLVSSNAVTSVPLIGRNYLQLGLLAPGTTTNNPSGINEPQNLDNSSRPFINGNREQANQYFLDGILNSEDKNNETSFTPNVDAIQEFNIITQNASAEFGDYEGGVISVSTKSGTNRFHGTVFEFLRNDKFDANDASAGWTKGVTTEVGLLGHAADGTLQKPEFRYNEFGVTVGGPIIKNKLFFFVDYQGLRDLTSGPTGEQLLTQRMRGGDFGQLCTDFGGAFTAGICTGGNGTTQLIDPGPGPTTGNKIPNNNLAAYIAGGANPALAESVVASNLFNNFAKYYPLPQTDTVASGSNFFYRAGTQINNDQGDIRIDYNISDKDHVFGRWSQLHLRNPSFTGCVFCALGNGGTLALGVDQPNKNAVVNWTHAFGANLLNEARVGFNAVQFNQNIPATAFLGNVGQQLGINNANFEAPGLLNINIAPAGSTSTSADIGNLDLFQVFHTTQGQFNDNLSITHLRHSIKTGFQFVRQRQDFQYAGNNGGLGNIGVSSLSGSGLADFYLGLASAGSGSRDTYVQPSLFKHRGNIFAAYVQDDWRITNTLTLNLGLRFEDHTPLTETENRMVNFGLFTGTIYTPDGRDGTAKFSNPGLVNNYLGHADWEPRFGFAWAPAFLNGKTVIRGGYSISAFVEGGGTNEQLTMNPPLGIFALHNAGSTLAAGYPTLTTCATIDFACFAPGGAALRIRVIDQNYKPATSQQWNLTVQHRFTNTLTGQLGYVGQHGTHLLNLDDLAQRVGLNAAGQIAKPGELIVSQRAGPYLGGGSVPCDVASLSTCGGPGSLYQAFQTSQALAGANMSDASQRYDALQAVLQKRMGNGLEGQVAYTYSKCLSNSPGYFGTGWGSTNATSSGGQPGPQNIYDLRSDWGPCFFDQTHVLSSYVTYALPFGRGKQFGHDLNPAVNAVVGNWEIGAIIQVHSGNALTLNSFGGWGAADPSNTNGIGPSTLSERPSCDGPIHIVNQRVNATSSTPGYIQWFDPNGAHDPAPNTFGTCSVGNVRGPKYVDTDLSLHKNFVITEGTRLQFRFEALNAFNHPVWTFDGGPGTPSSFEPSDPAAGYTNPLFGRITGSQSPRSLQFGLKFIY